MQGHLALNKIQRRLTQAAHYCLMQIRVNRPLLPAVIRSGAVLQTAQLQLELKDKHRDGRIVLPAWNKALKDHMFHTHTEKWVEQLDNRHNPQKALISYVMRKNFLAMPDACDPVINYITHDNKCVTRMRIIKAGREGGLLADLE